MGKVFDENQYELSSDLEVSAMLAEIPLELTQSSIRDQIRNPLLSNVNFLESFLDRCNLILEGYDDEEVRNQITTMKSDMAKFILQNIDECFGFDFELEDVEDNDEKLVEYADVCYCFFILNYKKNISKYVYKMIKRYSETFANTYRSQLSKKDVAVINARDLVKKDEYVVILASLPRVIRDVMGMGCDPVEFVEMSASEDSYEGEIILEMLNEGVINGNYIDNYFGFISNENGSEFSEVYSKVRSKIINQIEKDM